MGITRVEHALAVRAVSRRDAVLVVFDRTSGTYRVLRPEWRDALIGWVAMLEGLDGDTYGRGWRALLPSRGPVVARLERWRLTKPGLVAAAADLAQRVVLAMRPHRTPFRDPAGRRIARVPPDLALGEPLRMGPDDVLFTVGSGWTHGDAAALARLRAEGGFRHATLCYDLIPVTHPQFWSPAVTDSVRGHWLAQLPLSDLVITTARCVAGDVWRFAAENSLPPPSIVVLPLGYDPPHPAASVGLPAGLRAGHYALFVSTIEPRKNHMTLLRAWRTLLARDVPQRHGFRLVFVGREGWMVEDVMAALRQDWQGTVSHLTDIDGPALDSLYEGMAFGLYPSVYEGFGLPVIEAFARGKAVLASTGGALPETVGSLSPCLPPDDHVAWGDAMATWIEDPALLAPWEARIATEFSHPDWNTAAGAILDAVMIIQSAERGA